MRFPFLKLPRELRGMVYKELLPHYDVIIPDVFGWRHRSGYLEPGSSALLRTCRLIQEEACDILYRHNVFRFDEDQRDDGEDLESSEYESDEDATPTVQNRRILGFYPFLLAIGAQNRFRLRKISFDILQGRSLSCPDAYALGKAFRLLARGHNLHFIEFRFHCECDDDEKPLDISSAVWKMNLLLDGSLNKDLRQIKGIQELRIMGKDLLYGGPGYHYLADIQHLGVKGMKGLKRLKKDMEVDLKPFQKAILEITSTPSKVEHSQTSVKRLQSLVDEYKVLKQKDQKLNIEKRALNKRLVKLDCILRKVEFAMQDSG